jgi:hypothetical protein
LGRDACGFCGSSPACPVFLQTIKKTTKITSPCTDYYEVSWAKSGRSSDTRPCTNVPIICELCHPNTPRYRETPAIWKYGMRAHIRAAHPSYVTPGWPAQEGVHGEGVSKGDFPLPTKRMAGLLNYGDGEEQRLGLSKSPEWTFIGGNPTEMSSSTKRRELKEEECDNFEESPKDRKRARIQ